MRRGLAVPNILKTKAIRKSLGEISGEWRGVLLGFLFSSMIGLILWLFAYLGFTKLGLPSRYDYEYINNVIEKNVPEQYSYRTYELKGFRGPDITTIAAIASLTDNTNAWNNYGKLTIKDNNTSVYSDILLLLDKNERGYEVSYRFQPKISEKYKVLLFPVIGQADTGEPSRHLIVRAKFYNGASLSDPLPIIFIESNGEIEMKRLTSDVSKKSHRITNQFNAQQSISVFPYHEIIQRKDSIYLIDTIREVCRACDDENTYKVTRFVYFQNNDGPSEMDKKEIKGYSNVLNHIESEPTYVN